MVVVPTPIWGAAGSRMSGTGSNLGRFLGEVGTGLLAFYMASDLLEHLCARRDSNPQPRPPRFRVPQACLPDSQQPRYFLRENWRDE
jgi:hypothetical protein